ncbi:protocadherin alpha-13-like [Delphinapterus leucas]|uniref:Protocadherin alpha-13-like n=1 Tax=Delphinapterus leucas TaxID=9749 RepID=A0A7F8KFF7_DELLE|nr:protocadherin alpha-13-like [Delphinapterus leucas]
MLAGELPLKTDSLTSEISLSAMEFSWRGVFEARRLLLSLLLLAAWETGSGQVHYSVSEEAKHGTFVGRIAQDLGLELTEMVPRLFRVASKGRGDLLEVNLQNGILFVNSRIDREELCGRSAECSIHLEVIVDRPLQVFHVEVEVKDINDNPPVFRGEQKVLISESAPLDSRFPLEGASDADIGLNSLVTYRLSLNEYFTLKVITKTDKSILPELILRKSLDREEMPELNILLTALDGGKPELTGTVQLLITILDVNDNAPEFDRLIYKVRMLENAVNGTLVIKLNATDPDDGTNADIIYSFRRPVSPTILYAFSINPSSGEIRTKGKLDFEEKKLYEISVEAIDKGNIPMAGHCTILVEIVDINDNAPEVTVTSLALPVREDAQVGTVIALISVSDRDSGANGQVTCSLMPHSPFKLVSTFKNYYSLLLDSALDRESVANYEVVVTVRDAGSPSLSATASVSVEVADVNDNAPAFAQPEYTVLVKENNLPGCHIFTVSARDADAQENALVSYSLVERRVGERALSSYVSVHPRRCRGSRSRFRLSAPPPCGSCRSSALSAGNVGSQWVRAPGARRSAFNQSRRNASRPQPQYNLNLKGEVVDIKTAAVSGRCPRKRRLREVVLVVGSVFLAPRARCQGAGRDPSWLGTETALPQRRRFTSSLHP